MNGAHLYVLPLGDRKPVPFLNTEFRTQEGQFSPNGRWVAYRSIESGRTEVYLQGFSLDSSQPRGKWQVSVAGRNAQMAPRWQRVVLQSSGNHFAVDVKTDGPTFQAGIPRPLF